MNPFAKPPLCAPGFVTVTVAAPALPAGVVAVMVVPFTTATLAAAAAPNVTVAPEAKFVPLIVTVVPPAVDPLLGDTLVTVGEVAPPDGVRKATICMTQGPAWVTGAVAL